MHRRNGIMAANSEVKILGCRFAEIGLGYGLELGLLWLELSGLGKSAQFGYRV